jgi:hypothetical protein
LVVGHLVDYKGEPDPREIARDAQWYAGELIARWSEKLLKIGEGATEIAITVSNAEMRASWVREGRKCSMVSRAVTKFNAHGTMFFQYPTRMKVDGASVTEAAYGEMFAK